MHGLTGGSWKRNKDRTRATEMKDTRGNLAVTSGSETYRRCALPRQLSTLLPRRNRHNDQSSQPPNKVNNLTMPPADVLTADVERTGCSLVLVGSSAGPSKVQILVGNSRFHDDGVLWAIIR